jgi:hypothetical protein
MPFPANTPLTLAAVTFTTEELEEERKRVMVMTWTIGPFTPALAEALNVRSLIYSGGQVKDAIESMVIATAVPLQRLTFAMAPDQVERRIVLRDVVVLERLRVKVNHDRDPVEVVATLKTSAPFPDAETLMYLANGVTDTHYLTFEAEQGDLLTAVEEDAAPAPPRRPVRRRPLVGPEKAIEAGEELRPGVHAEH